ncbi:MAG: T9SS type A sorting domain-containing protein [Bacteroidia bacterium]
MHGPSFSWFLSTLAIFVSVIPSVFSQVHKFPDHGGKGVPGAFPYSFVFGWGGVEGVLSYQYVISDNPLCFSGCSGDTREGFTPDTFLVAYNMEPDRWYYWITRMIMVDGDTSEWSLISSFLTETPENSARMVSMGGNPVSGRQIPLRFNWALNPEAARVTYKIYNLSGTLLESGTFSRSVGFRLEEKIIPVPYFTPGLYILEVEVGNNLNNFNNHFTIKVILL